MKLLNRHINLKVKRYKKDTSWIIKFKFYSIQDYVSYLILKGGSLNFYSWSDAEAFSFLL